MTQPDGEHQLTPDCKPHLRSVVHRTNAPSTTWLS